MKKLFSALLVSSMLICSFTSVAFADSWIRANDGRWWYRHDNGTFTQGAWELIDGKYYYFDGEGWMLSNTTTPDGYYVGADGAWAQNGAASSGSTQTTVQETAAASASTQNTNVGAGGINLGNGVILYTGSATDSRVNYRGTITVLDGKMVSGPYGSYAGKLSYKFQGTVASGGKSCAVQLVAYDASGYELSWNQMMVKADESGRVKTQTWSFPKGTSYIKVRGR